VASAEHCIVTWGDILVSPCYTAPHVVILGSGASAAAFPNGDANGKAVPTMQTLVKQVGLSEILRSVGITEAPDNFEVLYSQLYSDENTRKLRSDLEEKIYTYFDQMRLPPQPTLYDLLLLSLRPKDIVATFNWDPFLFDAYERNRSRAPLPAIVHLHGNVRIGSCSSHGRRGRNGEQCPDCGRTFRASRLLFPIKNKDYSSDKTVSAEWSRLKSAMREAFTFTVFGYGAPSSDVDAVALMRDAWRSESRREASQIEAIDLKSRSEIWPKWREFFVTQHCTVVQTFSDSFIRRWPRRSCEALFQPVVYGKWAEPSPAVDLGSFENIENWLAPLVAAEEVCRVAPQGAHARVGQRSWAPATHG
jgi:hypothetical protein